MKLPPASADPEWTQLRDHDVSELWDQSINPHVASGYAARLATNAELVGRLAGQGGRVLDVGCAQGTLGLLLAERGYRVTLLDLRAVNIAYARDRYESGEVDFYCGLLTDDLPPRNDYDVVSCTEVLEHVQEPSRFIQQLARKVRPGGAVFLTTPNANYAFSRLPSYAHAPQQVIDEAEPNSLDGNSHRFLYTQEELIVLARGAGLRIEAHGFFVPFWLEGHAKTRHAHRLLFQARGKILELPATLGSPNNVLARRLCSSQWLVARRS